MFSSVSICLLVGWSVGLHKNSLRDFHNIWMEDGSLNRINTFWYSAFSLISRGIMHKFWWKKFMWLHVNSISICHISKSRPTVEILFYIILSFTFIITVVSIYLHFWCDCKYFSEYCISPPITVCPFFSSMYYTC